MQIKDLTGLSKPLTRLIEVLSDGIGAVSRPYLLKKNADAKAYEIRAISEALRNVAEEHHLPVVYSRGEIEIWQKVEDQTIFLEPRSQEERIQDRLDFQERKRQRNIENVASVAAAELSADQDIADERPDEDWITRFFTSAQDVSSEQLQDLWGRILAGEIKRPGSYSLRTLEFIRNLTKAEASILEELCKRAITWESMSFIASHDLEWLETNRQIYHGHHFAAGELGALYPTDLMLKTFRDDSILKEVFVSGDLVLLVNRANLKGEIRLPVWNFTRVGVELLQLIPSANDDAYVETLGRFYVRHQATAVLGKIVERLPNKRIRYETLREIVHETPEPEAGT